VTLVTAFSPAFDFVNSNYLDLAWPVRKVPGDNFLVDDLVADRYPLDEAAMQIGLFEAGNVPLPDSCQAAGEQLRRVFKVLRVSRPTRHECVDVARVVGVKLSLDHPCGAVHNVGFFG
jgi:hypothetical protein